MAQPALYDVLTASNELHKTILRFAEGLTEAKLNWKPPGYSVSIGFHLWHLAREADFLRAYTLAQVPQLGTEFGSSRQIWEADDLASKWGFPAELGAADAGTGISPEIAASLPLPSKTELLDYLQRAYAALDSFIEQLDAQNSAVTSADERMQRIVGLIRREVLVYLLHDARHLGMMECLLGLLTGFGSATEERPK